MRAYPYNFLAGAGRGGEQHRLRPSASNFGSRLFLPVRIALAAALWPRARAHAHHRVRVLARENQNTEHRLYYYIVVHHTTVRRIFNPEEYTSHYIIIFLVFVLLPIRYTNSKNPASRLKTYTRPRPRNDLLIYRFSYFSFHLSKQRVTRRGKII